MPKKSKYSNSGGKPQSQHETASSPPHRIFRYRGYGHRLEVCLRKDAPLSLDFQKTHELLLVKPKEGDHATEIAMPKREDAPESRRIPIYFEDVLESKDIFKNAKKVKSAAPYLLRELADLLPREALFGFETLPSKEIPEGEEELEDEGRRKRVSRKKKRHHPSTDASEPSALLVEIRNRLLCTILQHGKEVAAPPSEDDFTSFCRGIAEELLLPSPSPKSSCGEGRYHHVTCCLRPTDELAELVEQKPSFDTLVAALQKQKRFLKPYLSSEKESSSENNQNPGQDDVEIKQRRRALLLCEALALVSAETNIQRVQSLAVAYIVYPDVDLRYRDCIWFSSMLNQLEPGFVRVSRVRNERHCSWVDIVYDPTVKTKVLEAISSYQSTSLVVAAVPPPGKDDDISSPQDSIGLNGNAAPLQPAPQWKIVEEEEEEVAKDINNTSYADLVNKEFHFPQRLEEDLTFAHALAEEGGSETESVSSNSSRTSNGGRSENDRDDDDDEQAIFERGASLEYQLMALKQDLRDEEEARRFKEQRAIEKNQHRRVGQKLQRRYKSIRRFLCLLPYKSRDRVVIQDHAAPSSCAETAAATTTTTAGEEEVPPPLNNNNNDEIDPCSAIKRNHPLCQAAVAFEREMRDQGQYDVVIGSTVIPPSVSTHIVDDAAGDNNDDVTTPATCCLLAPSISLPLQDPNSLFGYGLGEPSPVGIIGHGDVVDERLRKSKELSLDDLKEKFDLLPLFHEFQFPDILAQVHSQLAPTATEIRAIPYKALLYEKDDFFGVHVDSLKHPDQFGSLALEIPIDEDVLNYSHSSSESSSEDEESRRRRIYYGREKSPKGSIQEVDADSRGGDLVFYSASISTKHWTPEYRNAADEKKRLKAAGGAGKYRWRPPPPPDTYIKYRYEMGLSTEEVDKLMPMNKQALQFLRGSSCHMGFRPQTDQNQMISRLTLRDPEKAQKKRDAQNRRYYGEEVDEERSNQEELLSKSPTPNKEEGVRAQWAAWLTDVPHEVRRIRKGCRISFVYNLIRVGDSTRPMIVPRQRQILEKAEALFSMLRPPPSSQQREEEGGGGGGGGGDEVQGRGDGDVVVDHHREEEQAASSSRLYRFSINYLKDRDGEYNRALERYVHKYEILESFNLKSLGVLLRHPYPSGNFSPSALKGVDAVLYQTLKNAGGYDLRLCLASECRSDLETSPFGRDTALWRGERESWEYADYPLYKQVFAGDVDKLTDTSLDRETALRRVRARLPIITGCLWIQLGLGELLTGGHSTGNCDCGVDWWYRTAVMIITPSVWEKRKMMMLLGLRGPKSMKRLYAVRDVFQIVLSFI